MQITAKLAWAYNGHNYDTEVEAIEANLKAIGQKIAKNHSSSPISGLLEFRDELAPLLIRHAELDQGAEVTSSESPEGTRSEELEGTRPQEPDPFDHPFDLPVSEEEEAA